MNATTTRTTTARKIITDMRELGYAIGNAERLTLESTANAHKAWSKADDATKKSERVRFLTGFVAGTLHASYDVAETILKKSRTERTQSQVRAVQAAMQKFKYHISRDGAKKSGERAAPVRVSSEFKAAAIRFVGSIYEEANAESLRATAKLLLAMAKKMK